MSPAVLLGLAKETVLELPAQGEMAVRMSTEVASGVGDKCLVKQGETQGLFYFYYKNISQKHNTTNFFKTTTTIAQITY